ncbi:MAG: hypothetical protein NTAFB05_22370 [Nitrobacter sp.]
MCMDESLQMTLSGVYAPTVNESETITDAQRGRSAAAVPETAVVRGVRRGGRLYGPAWRKDALKMLRTLAPGRQA